MLNMDARTAGSINSRDAFNNAAPSKSGKVATEGSPASQQHTKLDIFLHCLPLHICKKAKDTIYKKVPIAALTIAEVLGIQINVHSVQLEKEEAKQGSHDESNEQSPTLNTFIVPHDRPFTVRNFPTQSITGRDEPDSNIPLKPN